MSYTLVNPYCSLDALKDELKILRTNTAKDDELNEAIYNASRWVDNYTGRTFYKLDYSVTPLTITEFDQPSRIFGRMISLPGPIITLTTVAIGSSALVEDTDFARNAENGSLHLLQAGGSVWWLIQGQNIGQAQGLVDRSFAPSGNLWGIVSPDARLTFTGVLGYAQASASAVPTGLPPKIALAARLVAAALSGQNRKEVTGLDGSRTELLDRAIPKSVFDMLGRQVDVVL